MKKALFIGIAILMTFTSCSSKSTFIKADETHIAAANGTAYVFLGCENAVCSFGQPKLVGNIRGEKPIYAYPPLKKDAGVFAVQNDPTHKILVCDNPNKRRKAYYYKAALPKIELSPDKCCRLEFIKGRPCTIDIRHITCHEGIIGEDAIRDFLEVIRRQPTAKGAGFCRRCRETGSQDGCHRIGAVYGYFKGEPNLALVCAVSILKDKTYAIRLGITEYVLPEHWLAELQRSNP